MDSQTKGLLCLGGVIAAIALLRRKPVQRRNPSVYAKRPSRKAASAAWPKFHKLGGAEIQTWEDEGRYVVHGSPRAVKYAEGRLGRRRS